MLESGKRKVGLFGGSFDPPHKGHLKISKIAIKKLALDKLCWYITKKNPFKNKTLFSLSARIKKCKLLTAKIKKLLKSFYQMLIVR